MKATLIAVCPMLHAQTGETALHVAVRFCHFSLAASLLKFIATKKSRFEAVNLVNEQNLVRFFFCILNFTLLNIHRELR
jgi:hypothetical protein